MDANAPNAPRKATSADRKKQALELRKSGATFASIGATLGISGQAAYKLVATALDQIRKETSESAEQLRQMELERLDALLIALWPRATDGGDEQATDRILKIMARRSALLGLDAPTRSEVKVTDADIDATIAAELARLATAGQAEIAGAPESVEPVAAPDAA